MGQIVTALRSPRRLRLTGVSPPFVSAASPTTPTFKLSYVLSKPKVIDIDFSMAPPGGADFHPIATGSATKDN
jgi:hypothetical protein